MAQRQTQNQVDESCLAKADRFNKVPITQILNDEGHITQEERAKEVCRLKGEPTFWSRSRHPQALVSIWEDHNSWQMNRKRLQDMKHIREFEQPPEIPELLENVMKSMLERFPELGRGEVVLSVNWIVDSLQVRRYIGDYMSCPA
ncbi:hypothetical protein CERZMDRAFT_101652 [Cercospora zeae-maydis SCOH1-5]|uniref:Uncharacterized protein n=1 Tax=Cercospora zeae-maydis SCOH1-5 TaxID=717836 RepID=A0A6A6F6H6_9PEZI|nr:hypothetical protein CERZMDRAFT_101652 [Cercospora zeae-maydis SCOH1-5]